MVGYFSISVVHRKTKTFQELLDYPKDKVDALDISGIYINKKKVKHRSFQQHDTIDHCKNHMCVQKFC